MRQVIPVMVASVVMTGTVVLPASAAVQDDGLWYFDQFSVADIHAQGITGEGVTIAVIDSPINTDVPWLADADIRLQESFCFDGDGLRVPSTSTNVTDAQHGTNVVSFLVGNGDGADGQAGMHGIAPDATVLSYATAAAPDDDDVWCYDAAGEPADETELVARAMIDAMNQGAQILSVSLGLGNTYDLAIAVSEAHRRGVIVVASLPNDLSPTDGRFVGAAPASVNGAVAVLAVQPSGELALDDSGAPNTHEQVTVVAPGTDLLGVVQGSDSWQLTPDVDGTSYATPIVASNLALAAQAYPQATGNQLIQSLIRNTGIESHELEFSREFGYGLVVTTSLLREDPTLYEDVNPLIMDDGLPPPDEIYSPDQFQVDRLAELGATVTEPTPTSDTSPPADTPDPTSRPADEPATVPGWMMMALTAVLAVLVATIVAVVVIVIVRNNRRRSGGAHGS